MKVLVTGGNGFTGKYVVSTFEGAGYQVLIGGCCAPLSINEVVFDVLDKKSLLEALSIHKPEGIIHLAGSAFVGEGEASVFYRNNTIGTINLLEAVKESGIDLKKIIISSSANIYGNPTVPVVDENTEPMPVNHYSSSKLAMENMVKGWFSEFPIIITRPFNYTGVGQADNFLVPKIVSHFKRKCEVIELGNINVQRDFSDVSEIALCYLKLFQGQSSSTIVNLCSGISTSLEGIIKEMEFISGRKIEIKVNPDFLRNNEIKTLLGDNTKLKNMINYAPSGELRNTLENMFNS
ncbi:GDP-mannose 4,6-dehydratase [Serratia proteamaculans]|uniref:GDP-mannose 4,6-dehydratase n=1 Tax=Serratia proteamaculans TaxID=28151 RepID=UPI002177B93B|nr:GDP-mannose 4,6-dehydratase [Serratia proteamaculans]CAI1564454.1 UDP-glucose 4-epimerase [Serratia proteamaculans]